MDQSELSFKQIFSQPEVFQAVFWSRPNYAALVSGLPIFAAPIPAPAKNMLNTSLVKMLIRN